METPTIVSSSYCTTTAADPALWMKQPLGLAGAVAKQIGQIQFNQQRNEITPMSTTRIVKVIIADTNENLSLDKRLLHTGDEKLTDLTDQELFFEVPITDILAKHNAVRAVTLDKKQSEKFGRDIHLEPARIRDLKMVVVNVAQF